MKANRKFVEENNDTKAVSAVIGVILMVAITVAIAATVYYYVTVLTGGTTGASSPTLGWSTDASNNRITITSCVPSDSVYGTSGSGNLVFKNATTGVSWYKQDSGHIATTETLLDLGTIDAGDIVNFNLSYVGTYTVVWVPTNEVLGSFSV